LNLLMILTYLFYSLYGKIMIIRNIIGFKYRLEKNLLFFKQILVMALEFIKTQQ